jgi:hypothetical protein
MESGWLLTRKCFNTVKDIHYHQICGMLGSQPTFATPWCGGGGQKVRHSRHNLATLDDAKQQQNDTRKSCGGQKLGRGPNTRLGWCGGHSCGVAGYGSKPNSPMIVLDMHPYDAILGFDWLQQYSPMTCDWANKTTQFQVNDRTVKLQGLQHKSLELQSISAPTQ